MDTRAKDFNRYLESYKIFEQLSECFARLFMFSDFDRPDHGIWFLQNCMDKDSDQSFIVNYDKLMNELAANSKIIKKDGKAKEKAKLKDDQAKKDEAAKAAQEKKKAEEKQQTDQANAAAASSTAVTTT